MKTPNEQSVLRKSVEIASAAHGAGMGTAPGRYEYEVEAAIDQVYLSSSAMSPAYPSIVDSGPEATILHYSRLNRSMGVGDLVSGRGPEVPGLHGGRYEHVSCKRPLHRGVEDIYRIAFAAQEAVMGAANGLR